MVKSDMRNRATGLSVYFPYNKISAFDEYRQYSKDDKYLSFLEDWLSFYQNESIHFTSYGDNIGNKLRFTLSADCLGNVATAEYILYCLDPNTMDIYSLGSDDDVIQDSERFTVDFEGRWIELDGHLLYNEIIDINSEYTAYKALIKLNDENALLIFAFIESTKEIVIIGVTYENDEFCRIYDLRKGDKIVGAREIIRQEGKVTEYPEENEFTYDGSQSITVVTLPDGVYMYNAMVTDVYGKDYLASTALVQIDEGKTTILDIWDDEIFKISEYRS